MILADKLIELRKKNGWSQEELAGQLGVSRQSVSKWESGASIPDLDKILKLSSLFGVSTDFLLKDSEELSPPEPEQPGSAVDASDPVRVFTLAEANEYLSLVRRASGKIALGVALCILSPTLLILFGALSDKEGGYALPEAVAVAVSEDYEGYVVEQAAKGTDNSYRLLIKNGDRQLMVYYNEDGEFLKEEALDLETLVVLG